MGRPRPRIGPTGDFAFHSPEVGHGHVKMRQSRGAGTAFLPRAREQGGIYAVEWLDNPVSIAISVTVSEK